MLDSQSREQGFKSPTEYAKGGFIVNLDIERMFSFHPADAHEKRAAHERVRSDMRQVAHNWNVELPESPEKTLAIRKLQEAMMYANSAIAQYL